MRYEEQLKDPRLENLTWKPAADDEGVKSPRLLFRKVGWVSSAYETLVKGAKKSTEEAADEDLADEDEETAGEVEEMSSSAGEMLAAAHDAHQLAESYLAPVALDDGSKIRFSMLIALLEGIASLKLWPDARNTTSRHLDRFGWGIDDTNLDSFGETMKRLRSDKGLREPWVIHARYIHSVVDTAVRLQLRYGDPGKPIVGLIIGDTPNYRRDEIKEEFTRGTLNVICMSDAGAEGINLQRSNRIVLLDVPVSPGRIEQIAGRVHRLGSTKAAQVTLLLPPEQFGTRVFDVLRKAASDVYEQATGAKYPTIPSTDGSDEHYFVRQLAEYEARLLTAVAEASSVLRSGENRATIKDIVDQVAQKRSPNIRAIGGVLRTGLELIHQQRERFADANILHIAT